MKYSMNRYLYDLEKIAQLNTMRENLLAKHSRALWLPDELTELNRLIALAEQRVHDYETSWQNKGNTNGNGKGE